MRLVLILTVILATCQVSKGQTTWYVDVTNCPGPGSGTDVDPFCSIQDAIDASADDDTIVVAAGIYFENLDLLGKDVAITGPAGAASTIIDGQNLGPVIRCVTGETRDAVISGFTIREGSGEDIGLPNGGPAGGGMLIDGATPRFAPVCSQ